MVAPGGEPNQYHVHGGGISVSYYPTGAGPVAAGRGPTHLAYQDHARTVSFGADDVRVVDVPDVGKVVSATISPTLDFGATTFSLVVPPVVLPEEPAAPVAIETEGVTTVHRGTVRALGHPQRASYSATTLRGTASAGILPL